MYEVFYPGDVDVIVIRQRVQHFNDGRFDEFQCETANTAAPVHKHTHLIHTNATQHTTQHTTHTYTSTNITMSLGDEAPWMYLKKTNTKRL